MVRFHRLNLFERLKIYGVYGSLKKFIEYSKRQNNMGSFNRNSRAFSEDEIIRYLPEFLIVTGNQFSPSHEYRVQNFLSVASELGIRSSWIDAGTATSLGHLPASIKAVIFWRTDFSPNSFYWLEEARSKGVVIGYDTDDLIFDREFYTKKNVSGLRRAENSVTDYLLGTSLDNQEEFIKICDFAFAATPQLSESFSKLGVENIFEIPIVLPRWMQRQMLPRQEKQRISILYASGTFSHDQDFESCKSAVTNILKRHREVDLTILGATPDSALLFPEEIRDQIFYRDLVSHESLISEIKKFDINLAALEINEFTDAKSATRFMHAGLCSIPTIATPTRPFVQLIEDGVNGFLARNKEEWFDKLDLLVTNKSLIQKMGENANHTVLRSCTVDSIKLEFSRFWSYVISSEAVANKSRSNLDRRILLILPSLIEDGGGHRMAVKLLSDASKSIGVQLLVIFLEDNRRLSHLQNWVSQISEEALCVKEISVSIIDLVVSTHHSTIPFAKKIAKNSQHVNLVQDYEPSFYPTSYQHLSIFGEFVSSNLNLITLGDWVRNKFFEAGIEVKLSLSLPVDREIYSKKSRHFPIDRKKIVFYYNANSERRLPYLVEESIRIIKHIDANIDISVFGPKSESVKFYDAGYGMGSLSRIELANLYRMNDIGVAFSPTNESLIPMEMMATGLPVLGVKTQDGAEIPVCNFSAPADPMTVAIELLRHIHNQDLFHTLLEDVKLKSDSFKTHLEIDSEISKYLKLQLQM
jgi:glycosyltransferase involved in cell wall biosynthesis